MTQPIKNARETIRRAAGLILFFALGMGVCAVRAGTVSETVTFSSGPNFTINPAFVGLSYEKKQMIVPGYFSATNRALIGLFNLLGPGVVRIGAGQVDIYNWNGISNCPPITTSQVDQLAAFLTNVPQWKVIYGLNFVSNSEANCRAEASYAAKALGPQLLGFEIGNEPDEYGVAKNHLRKSGYRYADYTNQWNSLERGVRPYGPLVGPATASFTKGHWQWTTNFAHEAAASVSMATRHYYRGNAQVYTNAKGHERYGDTNAMMLLMANNPVLPGNIRREATAVSGDGLAGGLRIDETGSMVNGGLYGVSDAYGSALWALDYMFTLALNGCQGVNFHGGGRSAYTPLFDKGKGTIMRVGPEFYAMKMFSLVPAGKVVSATVSPPQPFFTAYGVTNLAGGMSVLLNNKDKTETMATTVNLGAEVSRAVMFKLTGSSWYMTNGYTLGGAIIETNGTWAGGQTIIEATNGQLTVDVPPCNAYLLEPALK